MSSITVSTPVTTPDAPEDEGSQVAARPENVPEKFWDAEKGVVNTEALLKAQADTEAALTKARQGEDNADDSDSDSDNQDAEVADALTKAGLDVNSFNTELESDGKLSEASYKSLEEAGYSKDMVDQYLAGRQNSEAAQTLQQQEIDEVKSSVENFDDMVNWAAQNLDDATIKTYNDMLESGSKQQAQAAVAWMNSMYTEADGKEASLLNGGEDGSDVSVFRSTAEVVAAMKDTRYGKDSAYTADIMKKVGRSNVFVK